MGYPTGPLLAALAQRVLANFEFVGAAAPPWSAYSSYRNDPPYADTQLLISLLSILVFPQESTPEALGQLFERYEGDLTKAICVRYQAPTTPGSRLDIVDDDGKVLKLDPKTPRNLPRFLRHGIAHFNMLPINVDGRFGGIRVWNRNNGKINFIADLMFDEFIPFARYILSELSTNKTLELSDPIDPFEELDIINRLANRR